MDFQIQPRENYWRGLLRLENPPRIFNLTYRLSLEFGSTSPVSASASPVLSSLFRYSWLPLHSRRSRQLRSELARGVLIVPTSSAVDCWCSKSSTPPHKRFEFEALHTVYRLGDSDSFFRIRKPVSDFNQSGLLPFTRPSFSTE